MEYYNKAKRISNGSSWLANERHDWLDKCLEVIPRRIAGVCGLFVAVMVGDALLKIHYDKIHAAFVAANEFIKPIFEIFGG